MASNKRLFVYLLSAFSSGLSAIAPLAANAGIADQTVAQLKSKPYEPVQIDDQANAVLFSKYCVGDAASTEAPKPNYSNALVQAAAAKLSETKTVSSEKLGANARAQFSEHVTSAKSSATFLSQVKDSNLSKLANDVLSQISAADTQKGFPAEAKKTAEQMSKSLSAQLATVVGGLNQALSNELKGVDYNLVLTSAQQLLPKVQAVSQPVDLAAITSLVSGLRGNLKNEMKVMDGSAIVAAAATLTSEIQNVPGSDKDETLSYVIVSLKSVTEQFANGGKPDSTNMQYQLSDIVEYVNSAKKSQKINLKLSPAGEQAFEEIKKQYLFSQAESVFAQLDAVDNYVNKYGSNALYQEYIADAIDSVLIYMNLNSSQLSPATIGMRDKLDLEKGKFSVTKIVALLNQIISSITSGDKSNALYYSESVATAVRDLALLKGDASVATLTATIAAEASKGSSATIIESISNLDKTIKAANGVISDDVNTYVNDAFYSLSELKVDFTPSTKALIAQFSDMQTQITNVATLSTDLKTESPSAVRSNHFYFYAPITKIYESKSNSAPAGVEADAHSFLTQLCGEYRDRASMIEAKLRWATQIYILQPSKSKGFSIDPNKNVWSQIPSNAYQPYLSLSSQVWEAKRAAQSPKIQVGTRSDIDNPVPGFSVCETKFMFSEYVGREREFDTYANYYQGYMNYLPKCSQADRGDYYDFRGDSNFKHYSPESNGMIWYATTIARACKSPTQAKPGQNVVTDEDCKKYFLSPFANRYNAARAGLATWLFHDDKHEKQFSSQGSMIAIYPHFSPELAPFSFSYDQTNATGDVLELDPKWLNLNGAWNRADIGFNELMGIGQPNADLLKAHSRLQTALDRHTDWYHSGWNDKNGTVKEQAYSPFVASSYVMAASDGFTSCGATVQCPNDGLKRWMFIFRVKAENWYTPARLLRNEPVNFDTMWFDETSFGDSSLANSEKAWDRLGTPIESEFESILYLSNVDDGSGLEVEGGPDVPVPAVDPAG